MVMMIILLFMLPVLSSCSSDGNIHLLEEDIAGALRNCNVNDKAEENAKRQRRTSDSVNEDPSPRIDANTKQEMNQYNHERRNTNSKMHVLNGSNPEYSDYGGGNGGEKFINTIPRPALGSSNTNLANNDYANSARIKRNEPLMSKDDNDQCLSQCVFANLQVVDSRGIPREVELWNKVHSSVTSQQSRTLLRDQIHACFQELQSESEDNGCYYSNKLERCLMLRFSDRKINGTQSKRT